MAIGPEPDWVPPGVDTKRANVARVYDYWLGRHPQLPRRPGRRPRARRGRAHRARHRPGEPCLPRAGPCGSWPRRASASSSTSARASRPRATCTRSPSRPTPAPGLSTSTSTRSRSRTARPSWPATANAAIIDADLREPEKILATRHAGGLIDFSQPVGLLLVVVLHFVTDAEDPWQVVATLRDALAPGSYLVLGHGTDEGSPAVAQATEKVYNRSVATQIHAPLARGDRALLRRVRARRAGPGLRAAVAARLARRRARRPWPALGPGRRRPQGLTVYPGP